MSFAPGQEDPASPEDSASSTFGAGTSMACSDMFSDMRSWEYSRTPREFLLVQPERTRLWPIWPLSLSLSLSYSLLLPHPHSCSHSHSHTHTHTFPSNQPPSPSRSRSVSLLIFCIRGIGGVRLRSNQSPFQDGPQLSQGRCSIELFSQLRRQSLEHTDRLRSWPSAQLEGDRLHRVQTNFVPVPIFSGFVSLPGWRRNRRILPLPSTFAAAVGLLNVTSNHCSSSLPGTVATTSILVTLIFSVPCLS